MKKLFYVVVIILLLLLIGVSNFLLSPSISKLMDTIVEVISLIAVVKWIDRFSGVKEMIIYLFIVLTLFILG